MVKQINNLDFVIGRSTNQAHLQSLLKKYNLKIVPALQPIALQSAV